MRKELTELVLQIMLSTCAIEEEEDFHRIVLSQISRLLGIQAGQLLVEDGSKKTFHQIARYPLDFQPAEAPVGPPELGILALETPKCLLKETKDSTDLFLPLKHEMSPTMILRLIWKNASPPEWIRDKDMLTLFSKSLEDYLPWKSLLLRIAAAKRNLEAIFDHLPFAVSVINADHTIERVNKIFTRVFNLPFNEVIGKKCYEVVHRTKTPPSNCLLDEVIRTQHKMNLEINHGTGLTVNIMPLVTSNGKPKSLHLFQFPNDAEGDLKATRANDFLHLYNSLSQPLTVVSLVTGLMLRSSNEIVSTAYLDIVKEQINSLMNILREARNREIMGKG